MENFNDSKALAIEIAKILDKKKAQDVRRSLARRL